MLLLIFACSGVPSFPYTIWGAYRYSFSVQRELKSTVTGTKFVQVYVRGFPFFDHNSLPKPSPLPTVPWLLFVCCVHV